MIPQLVTGLGVLLMVHSALSCLHYRSLVEDLGVMDAAPSIPLDVQVEVLLGWIFCLMGRLLVMGQLRPIQTTSKAKSFRLVAPSYMTRDFDRYDTRWKGLRTS
eukprot:CAMPEP_0194026396 /NCGR_PEP_ID=MMETSP0009_2-20130614/719_1 /TAXON_ID=210454 /ORGANISM="Grammatophora oceanica, Strain CCMP 410" /LENGTH=103 /DNA_ID=CAMNT_0038665073 /DNA_START=309 /DNA_END=620 /DNA_ORIENTATION=-